jgi:hypothetical protein
MAFRRRRGRVEEGAEPDESDATDADELDGAGGDDPVAAAAAMERPQGPWDADDVPADEQVRLDLGSLLVPGHEGLEVQVNLDEASGTVVAVTVVLGDSALQLQAFAAPRNEGVWQEVRQELAAEITSNGGLADLEDGEDGRTLRAQIPFPQPDGSTALGTVRFIGTDGPRWLLRGVLSGPAAVDPAAAGALREVYDGVVVVRGTEAFAPREPLPLRLPGGAPPVPDGGSVEPLDISGTGQHITEIR